MLKLALLYHLRGHDPSGARRQVTEKSHRKEVTKNVDIYSSDLFICTNTNWDRELAYSALCHFNPLKTGDPQTGNWQTVQTQTRRRKTRRLISLHGLQIVQPFSLRNTYIILPDIPRIENGLFQSIVWESLFSLLWIKDGLLSVFLLHIPDLEVWTIAYSVN